MILRRETLKAALAAASDGPDRGYWLDAVQVRPDGSVVATDGCICLVARDKYPQEDSDFPVAGVAPFKGNPEKAVLLPVSAVKALLQALPKKSTIPILQAVQLSTNGTEGGIVVSATDLQAPRIAHVDAEKAGGNFPITDRVMVSKDRPALQVTLSTDVLKALIAAAEAVQGKRKGVKSITLHVQTEPQHQGGKPRESEDHKFTKHKVTGMCEWCGQGERAHQDPDGTIIDQIRVTIAGDDVDVEGVVMPCR